MNLDFVPAALDLFSAFLLKEVEDLLDFLILADCSCGLSLLVLKRRVDTLPR